MPTISLIIPVYNTESYLSDCLDSCINQTFKDIEIICINDASTDNSKTILEQYAKQDKRIKIINHINNKRQGAARNTGVEAAVGDYCWFIDSDDYILLNACEILNDIINEFKTDVIRFNRIDYKYDINSGEKTILPQQPYSWESGRVYTKADYNKLKVVEVSPCMYITSTALLKTVKFREGVLHEDNDFTPILFSKAETIYNSNYSFYCVRQRLGSTTRNVTGLSEKRVIDNLFSIISLYNFIISEKLSKKHFCTRTMVILFSYIQIEYNKQPEIHTPKIDNEIIYIRKIISPFINYIKFHDKINYYINKIILFRIIYRIFNRIRTRLYK